MSRPFFAETGLIVLAEGLCDADPGVFGGVVMHGICRYPPM
jgi:hypothetical protein